MRRAMRDVFLRQADRVEERLEEGSFVLPGRRAARADTVLTVDSIFDLGEAIVETLEEAAPALQQALAVGYRTGGLRIEIDNTYNPEEQWVQRALVELNDQMRRVPQNTRAVINEIITEGQSDASLSVDDIANNITDRLRTMASGTGGPEQQGSVTRSRARRIAATSTTTAFEKAQDQAWRESDVEGSSWLSQRDGRVSEGHFEADGQRRQIGQPFQVRRTLDRPKEPLMHPGDPSGRASNIVNCRCSRRPLLDMETE